MACPPRRTDRRPPGGRTLAASCTVAVVLAVSAGRASEPVLTPISDDVATLTGLATPASGQTLYCLDGASAAVIAVDPQAADRRRTALAATGTGPRPLAIACIDSSTLAALCLDGDAWSLRTWRVRPDQAADPAAPSQSLPLGTAAGRPEEPPRLVVARSREWIAVVGLPAPLPSVLRAPIAGARLAAASDRGCPKLPAGTQPVAAAAGPADELVLVTAGRPGPGDAGPAADLVTYYSNAGRPLLALDSGLRGIRAAAFGRDDGRLWVVAEEPTPGLWRLDAAFVDGRQTIRGSHVARFATAAGLVSLADRAIAVLTATPGRRLVRIELDTTENSRP